MAADVRPEDLSLGEVFDRVADALIVADAQSGCIVLWNRAAERIFGYAAAEATGRPITLIVPPRLRARQAVGLVEYRQGRQRRVDVATPLETEALRRDGTEIAVEATWSSLADTRAGRRYILAVVRDVSERRRLAAERERLLAEQTARAAAEAAARAAREAVRLRDDFLSVAAHELKTPITTLRGFAQLLLRPLGDGRAPDPAVLGRGLATVERQSTKLARLVEQLLDVGRIEARKLALSPTPTNVAELARGVVAAAQAVQPDPPSHQLSVAAPPSLRAVVDPLRLEQVLTNLVDNAVKYSPEGGPVELRAGAPDAATVELAVSDRGRGIPPEARERIFDRFYQAHAADHASGMGLGLYISRQIVELHGGKLRAEFPAEGGTRFVVTVPSGMPAAAAGEAVTRPATRPELGGDGDG